jgi:ectoine hydroxylase-related dioxygenase (phytanoyl-CoA dioxygenase family)
MMPHRVNDIYLQAMRHPALVNIINRLVDGKAVGLQTELFYCKPGTRGFSLHQDNFFVQAPFGAFASAWVALTDTYAEKGGLIVYPGTHKEGLLPVKKLEMAKDAAQDPNANNEETIVPEKYQVVNASVPKGAVLFIHGHVVHGSNPNQTDEWRHVLLNTYIREGEEFRPGNYARREAVQL